MLTNKMTKIISPENQYPVICTLNVLEYIQNKYKTITKFQILVSGIQPDGKDQEGEKKYKYTPINIAALLDGITAMINEGIDIENEAPGEHDTMLLKIRTKDAARILRDADIPLADAAEIVLNELTECILPKNARPAQGKKKAIQQSTLRGSSLWGKISSIIRRKK